MPKDYIISPEVKKKAKQPKNQPQTKKPSEVHVREVRVSLGKSRMAKAMWINKTLA